jgi:hypothetical protein
MGLRSWVDRRIRSSEFTPGGIPEPIPSQTPTTFVPPGETVAPDPLGRQNIYESESGTYQAASPTGPTIIQAGKTPIPIGARVSFLSTIGGQLATAGAIVMIYLIGHNTGEELSFNMNGSVEFHFVMPVLDSIDVGVSNQDSVTRNFGYTWQAVTP